MGLRASGSVRRRALSLWTSAGGWGDDGLLARRRTRGRPDAHALRSHAQPSRSSSASPPQPPPPRHPLPPPALRPPPPPPPQQPPPPSSPPSPPSPRPTPPSRPSSPSSRRSKPSSTPARAHSATRPGTATSASRSAGPLSCSRSCSSSSVRRLPRARLTELERSGADSSRLARRHPPLLCDPGRPHARAEPVPALEAQRRVRRCGRRCVAPSSLLPPSPLAELESGKVRVCVQALTLDDLRAQLH